MLPNFKECWWDHLLLDVFGPCSRQYVHCRCVSVCLCVSVYVVCLSLSLSLCLLVCVTYNCAGAGMNFFGMFLGSLVVRYFEMPTQVWVSTDGSAVTTSVLTPLTSLRLPPSLSVPLCLSLKSRQLLTRLIHAMRLCISPLINFAGVRYL